MKRYMYKNVHLVLFIKDKIWTELKCPIRELRLNILSC